MNAPTPLKKISIKNVMGESGAKAMIPHIGKVICAFGGSVNGFRTANSQYGESLGFQGQFAAINFITGEQFSSNEAFFPRTLEDTLKNKLAQAPGMDVEFQAEVMVAEHPTSGFSYVVRPVSTKETVKKHQMLLMGLADAAKNTGLLENKGE